MFKKLFALSMALVMALALFAGCGSQGTSSSAPAPAPAADGDTASTAGSGEDVVITYISSTILETPEGEFEQRCIDEFNALDNGIHVEVEGVNANDLMKKYITLATSDSMPDFFLANLLDTPTIVDMGLAAEVSPIFGDEYIGGFNEADLASASVGGVAYGIPWFGSASGVLYRKDLFDAKELEPPTTWEEMVEVAKALTEGDSYGITLVGANNGSGAGRFQYVLRNFGLDEFTQDENGKWVTDVGSQKYIDALRAYTDLDVKEGVVPPGAIETDYPTAVNLFSSGKAAMLITGSNAIGAITSQVPELKGKLGSFPVPAVERSVSAPGGFGYFISTSSPHQAEAAEFIKFMMEKDREIEFAALSGRLPTRLEALQDSTIKEMPEMSGFLQAMEVIYQTPTIPGYTEVQDVHGQAYQSVLTGEATVEEAAAKAMARAQEICDNANEG